MEDTVQSVLCDKLWAKDADAGCSMRFRKEGTGDILCARELNVFLDSEFDWKLGQGSTSLDRAMDAPGQDASAELHIELTITKRPSASRRAQLGANAHTFDDDFFSDEVFAPKTYAVRLERGRFSVHAGYTWRYGLRLLFDKSPFPPPELWKKRQGAAEGNLFHERVDFYADTLEVIRPDGHRME